MAWYPASVITGGKARDLGPSLFFYGEAPDSLYTDAGVYRLEKGQGLLMTEVPAGAAPAKAGGTFAGLR